MRQINQKGLEIIKKAEGLYLEAYLCPAGVWTIGYGHTGPDVYPGLVIDEPRAEELLKQDCQNAEKWVERLVKVPLTENQFSALVSLVFNIGSGNFAKSTLLKFLNEEDYQGAANQFSRWVLAKGKKLGGLVIRRADEQELFEEA